MEDLDSKLQDLKLALGTNLTEEVDALRNKYMGRGFLIGGTLGAVLGFAYLGHLDNVEPAAMGYFVGTFLGFVGGINLGSVFGLVYGRTRGVRHVKKRYPDQADTIQEYMELKDVMTAKFVRGR